MLADTASRFFHERWVPRAAEWRAAGMMGPDTWREAGRRASCVHRSRKLMAVAAATSATMQC